MSFTDLLENKGIDGIRKQGWELINRKLESRREQKKINDAGKKFLCKYDLKYLCKDQLGYEDWDVIHDDMQSFLDKIKSETKDRQFRLLLIPRGHLKSSIVTIGWAIQQILRNPNTRILIAHAIWDHARGFARTIMQFFSEFSELPKLFGEFKPKFGRGKKWSPDGFTIEQRNKPLVAATVTTTGVERTQTGQHYDIIIMDDVVARENINTPEQREKVKNYFRDCLSILEPDGIIVVVGTTWHDDDLYSSKNEDSPGLLYDPDFKVFKRVAEEGTEESVLFKNKFSYEGLMKIKRKQGNYLYSAQYLLNPYPDEDMTFRKEWIHYYRLSGENYPSKHEIDGSTPLYVAMTIDPSMGKEKGDFAAIVTVGIGERYKYVLEAKRFKRKMEFIPEEVVKSIKDLGKKGFKVDVIGLESFGFQQSLLLPIQKAIEAAGLDVHVELLPSVNNKTAKKENRIEGLIPNFCNYEVYVHQEQKALIDELLRFNPTIRNLHDDLIDALAWNKVYWHRKPKQKVVEVIKEGSFAWMMKRQIKRRETDIFCDYR